MGIFDFVKDVSRGQCGPARERVEGEWTTERLAQRMDEYGEGHGLIRMDPEARNTKHFRIDERAERRAWELIRGP